MENKQLLIPVPSYRPAHSSCCVAPWYSGSSKPTASSISYTRHRTEAQELRTRDAWDPTSPSPQPQPQHLFHITH